jgi:hypothetical protein
VSETSATESKARREGMNFLVDHNLERQAIVLLGNIANQGWPEIIPIRFVTFKEMELLADSSDSFVWQVAQAN